MDVHARPAACAVDCSIVAGPRIPLHRPFLPDSAIDRVADALASRNHAGDAAYSAAASQQISQICGRSDVLVTSSGTHALELAATVLGLGPGDEVVIPSFTFSSTANAFALHGATPVFVDIRPDTWNLDERQLPAAITPRTRAIVAMHYGGVACDMAAILALAEKHDLAVIEDNAHGFGGAYGGQPLGTFGDMAALSFHETKNVECGEGGALVVNDKRFLAAAETARDKGTNRAQFFRGEIDKYTWQSLGSSHLLGELSAALLCAQLDSFTAIQSARHHVWEEYHHQLLEWADQNAVAFQLVPEGCGHAAHLFAMLMPTAKARTEFIAHMRSRGIGAAFHYQPLHMSPAGRTYGRSIGECEVSIDVSDRIVRLPIYPDLGEDDLERVVRAAGEFAVTSE